MYLPPEDRLRNLKNLIARSRRSPPGDIHEKLAKEIIEDDEKGIGKRDQNVQDTFPLADVFIDGGKDIAPQTKRFVELVFGEPFTTPTIQEYAMFVAKASALRSCDLSRQVGAVIVDCNGSVVSTGCNEVPYPDGGFFVEGRKGNIGDNRDYREQMDPNYTEIQRSLIELFGILQDSEYIAKSIDTTEMADNLLHGKHKELMSNARVRNLIEFGRVVHAEMQALAQAASLGRAVKRATLYCTVYPCHVCARHIIAAGISEVVYIEPYPKSLTEQLYSKEICTLKGDDEVSKSRPVAQVGFRPFSGIAPVLYQRVFAYRTRKNDTGTIATWEPRKAKPVGASYGGGKTPR